MSTITSAQPEIVVKPGVGKSMTPRNRSTPLWARGEPMVWLTGSALALCAVMIVSLLAMIVYEGGRAFWPDPIDRVKLADGSVFLGIPVRDEAYDAADTEEAALDKVRSAASSPSALKAITTAGGRVFADDARPIRRLYRVGNRELLGQPFKWVPVYQITQLDRPSEATLLERTDWGVWLGEPKSLIEQREVTLDGPADKIAKNDKNAQGQLVEREVIKPLDGNKVLARERVTIATGASETMLAFNARHDQALDRAEQIKSLQQHDVGVVNRKIEAERLALRQAEIELERSKGVHHEPLGMGAWSLLAIFTGLVAVAAIFLTRKRLATNDGLAPMSTRVRSSVVVAGLWLLLALGLVGLWAERPWSRIDMSETKLAQLKQAKEARDKELSAEYQQILAKIAAIDATDATQRLVVVEPTTAKFSPVSQTQLDEPMRLSGVVRAVQPNQLSFWGKLGVYASRWWEFISADPRESNTAGGVYPIIFGTVLLTILLSIVVVPLGVIAALYLREYAKQGFVTSAIRIAVNNLAGVPSIVYGVFGLGFFCYTVGQWVDEGLPAEQRWSIPNWWLIAGAVVVLAMVAVGLGTFSRPAPGVYPTAAQKRAKNATGIIWLAAVALVVLLVAFTPYFHGLFEAKKPSPTFGAKGLLWSSLTLALLTLPVVIVATEEAIAAVPRSMREGSYGCGASKWQTIRRIVLPRAMPGIMTGMILAMARGAGEVAPLMLVGVVKKASELPVTGQFPYLHLDQSFMHLGFHIFDVGFQSPDSEAARPLVWCTTLLLILVVVMLNLTAIRLRNRLRKKYLGETF